MMPSWSRSHCTAAPVTAIDPSSAKVAGSAPNLKHTVVSKPLADRTMSVPVFSSRKLPVPYVFLASPGAKHTCPAMAACWSPSMPVIGSAPPNGPSAVVSP